MYPKCFFCGFQGEVLCCNPQKALRCVNTRLSVYRMSKLVQRPKRYVRIKILRTKKEQELSYRQQIARQLRIQYAEGIYRHKYYTHSLTHSLLRLTS